MPKVDETSQIRPVEFDDLFDLEKRLLEMKDQQLEAIVNDVLIRSSRSSRDRQAIWLQIHQAAQKEHSQINHERIAHVQELHGIGLHSLAAVAGMFSAFAGGPTGGMLGGLMQLVSVTATKTGEYKKEHSQGKGLTFTHRYDSLTHLKQSQWQQAKTNEGEHKETARRVQQIADSQQSIWHTMARES